MRVNIMMGPSGAGKSTFIREFAKNNPDKIIGVCSADLYFLDREGKYMFDASELGEAHSASVRTFVDLCQSIGYDEVFVDNTNLSLEEIAPYYALAKAYGHSVRVVQVYAPVETCIARNVHGVPEATVRKMHARFTKFLDQGHLPVYWDFDVLDVTNP